MVKWEAMWSQMALGANLPSPLKGKSMTGGLYASHKVKMVTTYLCRLSKPR